MARPKKKNSNPKQSMEQLLKQAVALFQEPYDDRDERDADLPSLRSVAEALETTLLRVRKLLITAGAYSNAISDEANRLYESGKSVEEIRIIMGLGKSSVNGYLPYTKSVYKPDELSLNAERIAVFRKRQQAVKHLIEDRSDDNLWDAIVSFQNYPFHTATGLPYVYELKKGRNGEYNRELIVNRRKESKSVVWSSVKLAFEKAMEMQGSVIDRPKALGDIRGISYIYPMLYRFEIIEVPEKIAKKMVLKR